MCKPHSASRGGYAVCLHRPTQGWTVGEGILLCKVSLLHPPSSLGLDGNVEYLPASRTGHRPWESKGHQGTQRYRSSFGTGLRIALQAASQPVEDGGLGIKSIFIEKKYWIGRSMSFLGGAGTYYCASLLSRFPGTDVLFLTKREACRRAFVRALPAGFLLPVTSRWERCMTG